MEKSNTSLSHSIDVDRRKEEWHEGEKKTKQCLFQKEEKEKEAVYGELPACLPQGSKGKGQIKKESCLRKRLKAAASISGSRRICLTSAFIKRSWGGRKGAILTKRALHRKTASPPKQTDLLNSGGGGRIILDHRQQKCKQESQPAKQRTYTH